MPSIADFAQYQICNNATRSCVPASFSDPNGKFITQEHTHYSPSLNPGDYSISVKVCTNTPKEPTQACGPAKSASYTQEKANSDPVINENAAIIQKSEKEACANSEAVANISADHAENATKKDTSSEIASNLSNLGSGFVCSAFKSGSTDELEGVVEEASASSGKDIKKIVGGSILLVMGHSAVAGGIYYGIQKQQAFDAANKLLDVAEANVNTGEIKVETLTGIKEQALSPEAKTAIEGEITKAKTELDGAKKALEDANTKMKQLVNDEAAAQQKALDDETKITTDVNKKAELTTREEALKEKKQHTT